MIFNMSSNSAMVRPGRSVDEMQHPVMRPAEAEVLEQMVGVADEIAIGEEHQLDHSSSGSDAGSVTPASTVAGNYRLLFERAYPRECLYSLFFDIFQQIFRRSIQAHGASPRRSGRAATLADFITISYK